MFNISFYLERFKVIKDPKILKREIIDAFTQVTGYALKDNEISFKKGVVRVESNSLIRSEIYQKRALLIQKLSSHQVIDIR